MHRKIVANASWIIACRIVQAVINLVISMFTARYLGPSNYGLISYAASITAFMVPLVQLGLRNTFVQEIIAEPEKEGETVGTIISMCCMTSIIGIVGIVSFVSIANKNDTDTIIVCALYAVSLFFQMTEMIQYWFQAKLLSKYTAITSLIAYVVVTIYKIHLLVSMKSVFWFSVVSSIDYLLISCVLIVIYYKLSPQKLSFSFKRARALFNNSKYYIISGMMVTIFSQTDKIMLSIMQGTEETGFYSAAFVCAGMSSFVFAAIIDSFRPLVFQKKIENEFEYKKYIICLYSIIIYMGLLQSVFLTVFSPIVISILYGESYCGAISILRIITWYAAFSYMGSVRNVWILAEKKQHILWRINLIGALLNIIFNLVLIPRIGANGAAIASVFTQFITNFVLSFAIKDIKENGYLSIAAINPKYILAFLKELKKHK